MKSIAERERERERRPFSKYDGELAEGGEENKLGEGITRDSIAATSPRETISDKKSSSHLVSSPACVCRERERDPRIGSPMFPRHREKQAQYCCKHKW